MIISRGLKMPIPAITQVPSIFRRATFGDGQAGIFRGRRRPEDPEEVEDAGWDFVENFETLNSGIWGTTTSGTGASASVSGGILTLDSGTDDNGYASIHTIENFGPLNSTGDFIMEVKLKTNHTGSQKMESYAGFINPGQKTSGTPADSGADQIAFGYNLVESGNSIFFQEAKNGGGGASSTTYYDEKWQIWTLYCKNTGGSTLSSEEATVPLSLGTTPEDQALSCLLHVAARANPGASQTMEVDYVKIRYVNS